MPIGSEDFYQGSPLGANYNTQALQQMNQAGQQRIAQRQGMSDQTYQNQVNAGNQVGQAIAQAPQAYQQGEKWARGKRQSEQAEEQQGIVNQAQRAELAQKQAQMDYYNTQGQDGKPLWQSQAEEDRAQNVKHAGLEDQLLQKHISTAGLGYQELNLRRQEFGANQKAVNKNTATSAAETMIKAGKSDSEVQQYIGGLYGDFSPADRAEVFNNAKKNVIGGTATSNIAYGSSPEGAQAIADIGETTKQISQYGKLLNAKNDYSKADYGSSQANTAHQLARTALSTPEMQTIGLSPAMLDEGTGGVSVSTSGISTRTDKMNTAISTAKNAIENKIADLKTRYGANASPAVRDSLAALERQLSSIEDNANAKTNIFTGSKSPLQNTQIRNAMNGSTPNYAGGMTFQQTSAPGQQPQGQPPGQMPPQDQQAPRQSMFENYQGQ